MKKKNIKCLTAAALVGALGWAIAPKGDRASEAAAAEQPTKTPLPLSALLQHPMADTFDTPVYNDDGLEISDAPRLDDEFDNLIASESDSYGFRKGKLQGTIEADNEQHRFRTLFDRNGVSISAPTEAGTPWNFSLGLARGETTPEPQMHHDGSQVEFDHGDLTEWYRHSPRGLQQGFVVKAPLHGKQAGQGIELDVELGEKTVAKLAEDGESISLTETGTEDSRTLYYSGLIAWDATGSPLPASMSVSGTNTIALYVDDSSADYPVVIDPFLSTMIVEEIITPKNLNGTHDTDAGQFGWSVAVDGNTAVVGDRVNRPNGVYTTGAAYIYTREAPRFPWELVKKVYPTEATSSYWYFGYSVGVSGDSVVVGSMYARDAYNVRQGAAYVYERDYQGTNNWGLRKKLFASNGAANDYFGRSVDIDNDLIAVGASGHDTGGSSAGAAYIFERNVGGISNWGQRKFFPRPSGSVSSSFGRSVGVDNNGTLLVGSYSTTDRADIFHESEGGLGNWGHVKTLNPLPANGYSGHNRYFGYQVSLKGDVAVMGGGIRYDQGKWGGAAYIFERNSGGTGNWGQVQELMRPSPTTSEQTRFGMMVAAGDEKVLISDPGIPYSPSSTLLGRAHTFDRNSSGVWELSGTTHGTTKSFGYSNEKAVALDHDAGFGFIGETGFGDDGAVHSTVVDIGVVEQEVYFPDGIPPQLFASDVDISGDVTVSGFVSGNADRAYAYVRTPNTLAKYDLWSLVPSNIKPSNGDSGNFGAAVATNGNTIYVGAPDWTPDGFHPPNSKPGAVFVFNLRPGGYFDYYGQFVGEPFEQIGEHIECDAFAVVVASEQAGFNSPSPVVFAAGVPLVGQSRIPLNTNGFGEVNDVAIWGDKVAVVGSNTNASQLRASLYQATPITPILPVATRSEPLTEVTLPAVALHSDRWAIVWNTNEMHLIRADLPNDPPIQVFGNLPDLLLFGSSVDLDEDNLVVGVFGTGETSALNYKWNNTTNQMDPYCLGTPGPNLLSTGDLVAVSGTRFVLNGGRDFSFSPARGARTFVFECH